MAQAILIDIFPPEKRASAFALYAVVLVTTPAVGPVLGGWITDSYSWRWIFFISVPIGLVALLLSSKLLHDPPSFAAEQASVRPKESYPSMALESHSAIVGWIATVVWELNSQYPVIDFRMSGTASLQLPAFSSLSLESGCLEEPCSFL